MSDFAQSGLISTLQQLNEGAADALDEALTSAAAATPIALILPCRDDDLGQPALLHILTELQRARFVHDIVISTNGLTGSVPSSLRERIAALPQSCRIIRSDAPAVLRALGRLNIASGAGKGRNIWLACGLIASSSRSGFIVTQDSDVSSFQYAHLARLCFAATHRELNYTFCKMYYSRAGERLYGRVSRLFFTPLLHASVRVLGRHPLLDFLSSFRYPLAGESVIAREHAVATPMEPSWGFELGLLCEMFRRVDPRRVAQIDGGRGYEHRHQPLGDAGTGLFAMCETIARTFFGCLLDEGVPICGQFFDALRGSFAGELQEALRRSRHLALINGFPANEDDDAAAAVFARAFDEACSAFLRGAPAPLLPAWNDLQSGDARGVAQLIAAVERDSRSLVRPNHKSVQA